MRTYKYIRPWGYTRPYIRTRIKYRAIILFCPRAGLSLQTQHSTLFSAFLFVSAYSPFVMMLSIIWYFLLPRTFFTFTISSRSSFSMQFLLNQRPSRFLFLFFISSSVLPSPTLSSTTAIYILSAHFTRSILLHIHIANASSRFCLFRRSVNCIFS